MLYVRNSRIGRKFAYPNLQKFNGKLCILYVRNVRLCRKIECFNGKLCTFSLRNVWICRKIEYPKLRKFNAKLRTLHTNGTSRFAEKLNVQNSGNYTGNFVRYMYIMSGFAEKLNVQNSMNSTENSIHYTYGMFGFEEKLIAIAAQIQWKIGDTKRTECLNL